ncbi:hypothetical protein GCM10009825_05110 [Arthrobacter humicola]|uniref:Uncharacterized protein n=1 Tax=Arthrobacter humicola TaxID=409291 RepID=A0ABP5K890_9MICC
MDVSDPPVLRGESEGLASRQQKLTAVEQGSDVQNLARVHPPELGPGSSAAGRPDDGIGGRQRRVVQDILKTY